MEFYTYLWLRDDGTPYYVGKGRDTRAFVCHRKGNQPPARNFILIEDHESEQDAFFAEKFLISYYGRKDLGTGSLINLTDGGDNPPKSVKGNKNMARDRSPEMRDKIRQGMLRYIAGVGSTHYEGMLSYAANVGENHHAARLKDAQVQEIRLLNSAGYTQGEIAKSFGVSQSHVSRICSGARNTRSKGAYAG